MQTEVDSISVVRDEQQEFIYPPYGDSLRLKTQNAFLCFWYSSDIAVMVLKLQLMDTH